MTLTVGLVMFPNLTQLDLTAPYEVFNRMPETKVALLASTSQPVRTEWGLALTPDATFRDAPQLDARGEQARYVTSVCSGALLLGAAGLLKGYRATTHWMSANLLAFFGATLVAERVVVDRNRITGGGVTAGIDVALVIASSLFGAEVAQRIQLAIEYDPAPPFSSGSPRTAPPAIRDDVLRASAAALNERKTIVERISATL
jgi:cyclohexyl-isocyanide hydratase